MFAVTSVDGDTVGFAAITKGAFFVLSAFFA